MKNINFVQIKLKTMKFLKQASKYSLVLIVIVSGLLAALIVSSVGDAITVKGSQHVYEEEIATFKSAVFDEDVIKEVIELSANDVNIRAKLPTDRNNPFLDF